MQEFLNFTFQTDFFKISALIILVSKSSFLFSNTPLFCCFNGIHSNFMAAIFSHLSTCNFSLNVLPLPYNIFFFKLIIYTHTHTHTHTHTLISVFHVGGVSQEFDDPWLLVYAQKWDTKKLFGDTVWLDQYCHLAACRNIRCWATLSGEHTPLPIVILCEYFLWGN